MSASSRPPVDIVSLCPFPAGAVLWDAEPGQRSMTAIVKGTFALAPGEVSLASAQDPLGEERHWDDNGMASMSFPGDYAPSKRKVDVTLVGHAYAPGPEPVTSIVARLVVGDLDKSLRVTGDRAWIVGHGNVLEPGPPAPFRRLPLRYERAALSADNPVGIDPHAPAMAATPALPNLEAVDADAGPPCFGPVAPTWRARRRLIDESANFWAHGISREPRLDGPPLGPAPPRFDFAFFNAAPADQQIDLLRPGTSLVLDHLHPAHPRLATRLPAVRPQVFRVPPDLGQNPRARVEEIILRCDSLWIDTDRAVVVLTWRGVADAGAPLATEPASVGRLVIVADPEGKRLRWDRVEKLLGEPGSTVRLAPGDGSVEAALDPMARRHDTVKGSSVDVSITSGPGAGIQDAPTNPLPPPVGPAPARPEGARPILAMGAPIGRPAPAPAPPPKATVSPPRPPRPPARSQGLTLRKDLTVQRYAEITAALAQKGAQRTAVLRAHLLTEAAWALVDQTWKKMIAAGAEQGDKTLADEYDDAYVAHQERLPRPVDLAAYARLQVAVERGAVGQVLAELDLELGDLVRLQRVWARRAAASPEAAAALAHAVDEARR